MMPIELGGDFFARQVFALQLVGGFESRDRLVDPSQASQLVPVHVDRVRHARGLRRIGRRLIDGFLHSAAVLVGMREVVVRRPGGGDPGG